MCKHNSLATKAPTVAAEWNYKANAYLGTPHTVTSQSGRAAGWLCHDCNHSCTAKICGRVHNQTGCPKCGPMLKHSNHTRRPAFAESQHSLLAQWDHKCNAAQGNFPSNTTAGSNKLICWLCTNSSRARAQLDNKCRASYQEAPNRLSILHRQKSLQVQLAGGAVP